MNFQKRAKEALIILLVLILCSCAGGPSYTEPEGEEKTTLREIETREESYYLSIIAAGDNIIHDPILKAAYKDGKYDFFSIYDHVKPYILPADIAFVNQETILGNSELGYSGYPLFSTPAEAGAALAKAGFSIINHATNHTMDRGEKGVISSMDHWDSEALQSVDPLFYLGIHRSKDEREGRRVIIGRNNFKIGFLSYTYGLNNIPLPAGKAYLVSVAEPETMADEIDALRPLCDYLVVSMHWGEEYREDYSLNQENLAAFLAEHDVDLVIGHHPHVLQPMAIMERSGGKTTTVFYSLGNFLSAHVRPAKEALLGGLAYVRLKKTGERIDTEEARLIPVITHYERDRASFSVYPLADYSEELAKKHWRRINDKDMTYDYLIKKTRDLFGPALLMNNPFTPEPHWYR